jgi:hypothetical protein
MEVPIFKASLPTQPAFKFLQRPVSHGFRFKFTVYTTEI